MTPIISKINVGLTASVPKTPNEKLKDVNFDLPFTVPKKPEKPQEAKFEMTATVPKKNEKPQEAKFEMTATVTRKNEKPQKAKFGRAQDNSEKISFKSNSTENPSAPLLLN